MHFRREDYEGYLSVNRSPSPASLAPLLQADDTVWAHDYHLIPFARLLRQQGFEGRLGFFLHVPFVPPSMLEAMPVARELVADLCAYDLVGFQTEEHARDFRDCAQRMLGATVDGEWIRIDRSPDARLRRPDRHRRPGLRRGGRARRRRQAGAAGRRAA